MLGPGTATQLSNISSAIVAQAESQLKVGDCVEIDGQTGIISNISSFALSSTTAQKIELLFFQIHQLTIPKLLIFPYQTGIVIF